MLYWVVSFDNEVSIRGTDNCTKIIVSNFKIKIKIHLLFNILCKAARFNVTNKLYEIAFYEQFEFN